MPELPDVEIFRRYLDSTGLNQKISDVDIRNSRILGDISSNKIARSLKGKSLERTRRHGKFMFAGISDDSWLVLHFGMTGFLKYFKDMEKDEKHDRVMISFENGFHLGYVCQRLLGRMTVTDSIDNFVEEMKLGPDAFDVNEKEFGEILANGRGMVKSRLMNQNILAGIGNIYADEILFQSRIHPKTEVKKLRGKQIHEIYKNMRRVIQKAIDWQAQPQKFSKSYLLPNRKEGQSCPKCSGSIETTKVSGRTAYYCRNCQIKS